MIAKKMLLIAALGFAMTLVPGATADSPPGSTANCLGGGYNPSAITNVCTANSGSSTPGSTGTIGTSPGPCVIGQTCIPLPTYNPNGGTPLPTQQIPTVTYADVNAAGIQCEAPSYFNSGVYGVSENDASRCDVNLSPVGEQLNIRCEVDGSWSTSFSSENDALACVANLRVAGKYVDEGVAVLGYYQNSDGTGGQYLACENKVLSTCVNY